MHQTVWLLGGAGRTRECRPKCLSNCLVTVFSTRTGSAQVKLCIKQFGYWVELVVPGSAGQTVCQTVWSQSSQHGQALLRSNYASNSLVTGWSWSYQGVPAKLFVKLFGHNLLNTDRLCSGQTMHQTVWLLGGAGRTRECRPKCLSNCLVTVFSTRTGSAQVKLCIKQFGYWVELVVPGSAGQSVCQTVWSQSSQHGQALLRSNYASNSLVTGWSWSYQGVPAKLFVKLFGHNLLNTDRLCSGQTMHQTVWLLGGAGRTRECRPKCLSNCLVTFFSTRTGSAQVKLCIKQFGYWVELVVPGSAGQSVCQTVWSDSSQHGQALLRSNYTSNSLVTGWSWSYQGVPAKVFVKLFGQTDCGMVNTDCGMWSHRDGFPGVVWSGLVWWCLGGTVGWFRLRWAHGSGCLDRGVVPPGRTTPRGRVGGRGQHRLWDVVTPGRIPRRGLVWSGLVVSGWDGGVVPVAVGSWVGLFGPWGGSSRSYHTPWSCGRSWSTQIVGCGHTGTDSPAWSGLVWSVVSGWDGGVVPVAVGSWVGLFGPWGGSSRSYHTPWSCGRSWSTQIVGCGHTGTDSPAWSGLVWWCLGGTVGWFRLRWAHGSGCLDRGVVPPGRTTPRGRVGGRGQHRLWDVVTPGRIPRRGLVWSGLVSGWDGGVVPVAVGSWVGLFGPWGGSSRSYHTPWSCGRSWSTQIVGCGHTGTDSPAWSGLVWSGGVWVGRWGGSGCGGLMGRVVWTVGWFLPAVPHPVVVWEVVVNTDCGMWSHRDGFPGVVWSGLVVVSGWDGGVVPVAVGSWVGLFGPWGGSSRPYHTPWSCGRSWSTQIVGCGHTGTDSPAWSGLVWLRVWVGRWGGSGCGGLMGRVVWTVGWFLPVVPHPVVVWEVVVNTDCGMWSHRDGFPGVVWSGLVGVWVGRWGGSGCGGLMGRVVWTVGWFLPAVPHPVVVWEVAVNARMGPLWRPRTRITRLGASVWQQAGDIDDQSALRIRNRLVPPV